MNRATLETATVKHGPKPWTAEPRARAISLSKHRFRKGPQHACGDCDMRMFFGILLAATALFGQTSTPGDLAQGLQKIAALAPDPCLPEQGQSADSSAVYRFFPAAAEGIVAELNAPSSARARPLDRARGTLDRLEQMSAAMNGAWPEEERFHYETLDLPPTFVVTMSMASSAAYYLFAVPDGDAGKSNGQWRHFEPLENPGEQRDAYGHRSLPASARPIRPPQIPRELQVHGLRRQFRRPL